MRWVFCYIYSMMKTLRTSIFAGIYIGTAGFGFLTAGIHTLGRAENQEIAARFVAEHPEFAPESFTVGNHTAQGGMLMLTPHRDGTDGFFILRLRRL